VLKEYPFAEIVKATGWANRVPNLEGTKDFSFFSKHNPTGSRGHPACHMMGTGDLYWG